VRKEGTEGGQEGEDDGMVSQHTASRDSRGGGGGIWQCVRQQRERETLLVVGFVTGV